VHVNLSYTLKGMNNIHYSLLSLVHFLFWKIPFLRYDNLQKYNLPHPEAVFDINFYRNNPGPFLSLAKEIWPGMSSRPTLTHHFIKLLQQKGQLLRIYTQNIDGLEVLAGVDPDKVIECHGHFRSAHCIDCKAVYDGEECKRKFINESSVPKCPSCGGYIKPSIVFFGEGLPEVFASHLRRDLMQCDFLLVMGTSLKVQPVALIPQLVPPHCPRLLLNREIVGDFEEGGSWRDVFISGDCDDRYV
jgi:NAD-dependent SIR2 family protein deacetylase